MTSPRAARAAIEYARKINTERYGGATAALAILDALNEVLTYATHVELRLQQHLVGGTADHPELSRDRGDRQ